MSDPSPWHPQLKNILFVSRDNVKSQLPFSAIPCLIDEYRMQTDLWYKNTLGKTFTTSGWDFSQIDYSSAEAKNIFPSFKPMLLKHLIYVLSPSVLLTSFTHLRLCTLPGHVRIWLKAHNRSVVSMCYIKHFGHFYGTQCSILENEKRSLRSVAANTMNEMYFLWKAIRGPLFWKWISLMYKVSRSKVCMYCSLWTLNVSPICPSCGERGWLILSDAR